MRPINSRRFDNICHLLSKINYVLNKVSSADDGLLEGNLGLAYYYYQFYKVTADYKYRIRGESLLESIFSRIDAGKSSIKDFSFTNGKAGFAFVMNWLVDVEPFEVDVNRTLLQLDQELYAYAEQQIETDNVDFLNGVGGIIHYFTSRSNVGYGTNYLDMLIERLYSRGVTSELGIWFKNSYFETYNSKVDFSFPHGLTGLMLVLANAYSFTARKELIEDVLWKCGRFILGQWQNGSFFESCYSLFPLTIDIVNGKPFFAKGLSWHYGDLNYSLALLRAGLILNQGDWIQLSNLVGVHTLLRKDEQSTLISDCHFSKGAAGIAQLYLTLYELSNMEEYRVGYEYWIEWILERLPYELKERRYTGKENSILNGLVGISFTLTSLVTNYDLKWKNLLLL